MSATLQTVYAASRFKVRRPGDDEYGFVAVAKGAPPAGICRSHSSRMHVPQPQLPTRAAHGLPQDGWGNDAQQLAAARLQVAGRHLHIDGIEVTSQEVVNLEGPTLRR